METWNSDDYKATCLQGDCLEVMAMLPDNSVDSIVTDPPYGLSFMGKKWDYDVPSEAIWREALRVLKPGGHLLAFAGTRTQHRMAVRIEDAGFEIRDMIAWVYGSGFPKSLDVSKAIDKVAGAVRETGPIDPSRAGRLKNQQGNYETDCGWSAGGRTITIDPPATDAAKQWQGFGTALKPAMEPITVARKPLPGTVAANVLEHGTGALNIDGCRVGIDPVADASQLRTMNRSQKDDANGWGMNQNGGDTPTVVSAQGRWPANLIHDGSEEVLDAFPQAKGQQGDLNETGRDRPSSGRFGDMPPPVAHVARIESDKSAARFFYCAKASKRDRDEGMDDAEDRVLARSCQAQAEAARGNVVEAEGGAFNKARIRKNAHPTVKPTDLMRYLCRLVTPPGGTVLDCFMGSGSTGKAAMLEGFEFIGIERDADSFATAVVRIDHAKNKLEKSL
jgi:DNA modification methylase